MKFRADLNNLWKFSGPIEPSKLHEYLIIIRRRFKFWRLCFARWSTLRNPRRRKSWIWKNCGTILYL